MQQRGELVHETSKLLGRQYHLEDSLAPLNQLTAQRKVRERQAALSSFAVGILRNSRMSRSFLGRQFVVLPRQ